MMQAYGIPYRGGKPDDITVLVTYVSAAETVEVIDGAPGSSNDQQSKL